MPVALCPLVIRSRCEYALCISNYSWPRNVFDYFPFCHLCSTGTDMSGGFTYTLTNLTSDGRPVWKNSDWLIRTYGDAWIWQPSLDSCCFWNIVNDAAPPWKWTGDIKATCTCPAGSALSNSRANYGKCIPDVSKSAPCAEGLIRSAPNTVCVACAGFRVAGASATTCVCPSGYTGADCTPPLQITILLSGAVDAGLGGTFVLL